MTDHSENTPTGKETLPRIETVEQAAAEIVRAYEALGQIAVDLTDEYLEQRLQGEEGVTWKAHSFFFNSPVPIIDRVTRKDGAILLGAYSHPFGSRYTLTEGEVQLTDDAVVHGITVHRHKLGYDLGARHVAAHGEIFRGDYTYGHSVPTTDGRGNFAWSEDNIWLGDTFHRMTEVDDQLLKEIAALRSYEPAA